MKRFLLVLISIRSLGPLGARGGSGSGRQTRAASHLYVTPANSGLTVGTAFNFNVTAPDASNRVVTGYVRAVHFTSPDSNAILPANSVLANGTGTLWATLKAASAETITAPDMLPL